MKIDAFRKVVATKIYETQALEGSPKDENSGAVTTYNWENTNKLLGWCEGLIGCKTGITAAAGPCFAGYYEMPTTKLAIILCNSKSLDQRWIEIQDLVEWYMRVTFFRPKR